MPVDRVKALEDEVEALKQANDGLYKQHANEKAQMQLGIEQEKLRVAELMEANTAFRDENDQWRVSYEALENAKRYADERFDVEKRELEEKVAFLEESVKSYTTELVSDLEELEKEKSALASREQTIQELQQQINEGNERFSQLMTEYDAVNIAFHQSTSEQNEREKHFATTENELRNHISHLDAQIADLHFQLNARSQDEEVKEINQGARLKKAEQDLNERDAEITKLTQRICQLEEEISLLTLTGGASADGKPGSVSLTATLRDLQLQLFQKSEELVQYGEKNLHMAETHDKLREQHQELKQEVNLVRSALLKGIIGGGVDETAYQHVKLDELIRLRLKAGEHELRLLNATCSSTSRILAKEDKVDADEQDAEHEERPPTHLANVEAFSAVDSFGTVGRLERELRLSRSRNTRLQVHIERLEREVETAMNSLSEFQALKEKAVDMVSRERVEKELRAKAEMNYKEATEKIVALSEHIEKLMVHLKHEAAAKTKAIDTQRRTDKELAECKDKISLLTKKGVLKDQQLQELEQGAKILEDQLRLMDEKFIDVRNKLDWTRATSQKDIKRLQSELNGLRMKWQMASDMGVLASLPDWAHTPKLSKKTTPLGSSSSESRLPTAGYNNNSTAGNSVLGTNLQSRSGSDGVVSASGKPRARFEIPKLPQPDSEVGTPWSDAKLSVLQRQLQDKRRA